MSGVSAFVLAGGKSSRMGRDKAFVTWRGQTLLERALGTARGIAGRVWIVGARATFEPFGEVVEDVFADRGPLGGIHGALLASRTDLNLVLAVDLPFVSTQLLSYLIERSKDTESSATVPRLAAGWEPLCATYRREFAEVAEQALREGRNAIHPLLEAGPVTAVSEEELEGQGFSARMFRNVNTVGDLSSASGMALD